MIPGQECFMPEKNRLFDADMQMSIQLQSLGDHSLSGASLEVSGGKQAQVCVEFTDSKK